MKNIRSMRDVCYKEEHVILLIYSINRTKYNKISSIKYLKYFIFKIKIYF